MSACFRICQGDAPPPCPDKDLSVTCNVAPTVSADSPLPPRLVKQRTERDRPAVGGSSVGDTEGLSLASFCTQSFQLAWFLSCGWAASMLFILLSGGEECELPEGFVPGKYQYLSRWWEEIAKAGFGTGVCDFGRCWHLKVKCAVFGDFEEETATSSVHNFLLPSILHFPFPSWACQWTTMY